MKTAISTLLLASALAVPMTGYAQYGGDIRACKVAVEGRIPWNSAGDTRWAPANVERLCRGGTGEEPARCFERLIRGQVSWGGGSNWEWENAVSLCHGSQDARATIACFEGQMKARIAWKTAITNCAVNGSALPPPTQVAIDPLAACRNAVEGRVPWNSAGDTRWVPANVDRLCRGGAGEEPARCFERLIRGQVSWGGGTNWEWENAVGLCHASQDSRATIACFEGQIRAAIPWKTAISNCAPSTGGAVQPVAVPIADQMTVCRNAVEGKVPWNSAGDTKWATQNVERLCRGGVADEPARCFERLMRGHVSWGGGTNWEWENASDLCRGSTDHRATIGCFESRIRSGVPWKSAIPMCRK
jgi:hypothetical protein